MNQPLLSIGMIVKNEERSLQKCLEALTPLRQAIPCELVIADTGSKDKTKEIASKYADILFDFTWVDDFSKARNAVMDKCTGKWYLSLDADEYLNSSVDEICKFLKSSLAEKKKFATITLKNHNDPSMNGTFTTINAPRLVKMDTNIRFEGIIHESFKISNFNDIQVLSETIFDHDGYTQITPEHLKEKEKRNLKLLEKQLKDSPEDVRCILLCLEASSLNKGKRKYYTEYAFEKLPEIAKETPQELELFGSACIATALSYAVEDSNPNFIEFTNWAISTFKKSYHILVDVGFYLAKYYYNKNEYESCEEYCKKYLQELEDFLKKDTKSIASVFASPIKCSQLSIKTEALVYLVDSLVKNNKSDEAVTYVSQIDFSESEASAFAVFSKTIANTESPEAFVSSAIKIYNDFFQKYNSGEIKEKRIYDFAISALSPIFSVKANDEFKTNNFAGVEGTIGLSAKIADSKNKAEAEKFLNQIENWEEFMPVALKQAILLKATLPEDFYLMSSSRLTYLINDLAKIADELSDILINEYCTADYCNCFPQASFIYNLLLVTLTGNNVSLSDETKSKLIDAFIFVADKFLVSCYNPELLKNEEFIVCIPTLHLFSWYLVKANNLKSENPLEYIKTLRTLINKIPQSKQVVEFLIEIFQKEAEIKKQEKIKNTSPELLKMAEQLKTMLSALPENSPELMAIKQSPVYKQLAFLIED